MNSLRFGILEIGREELCLLSSCSYIFCFGYLASFKYLITFILYPVPLLSYNSSISCFFFFKVKFLCSQFLLFLSLRSTCLYALSGLFCPSPYFIIQYCCIHSYVPSYYYIHMYPLIGFHNSYIFFFFPVFSWILIQKRLEISPKLACVCWYRCVFLLSASPIKSATVQRGAC